MDFASLVKVLRSGQTAEFPEDADSLEFARSLDAQDKLGHLRDQFILPTKGSLKKTALDGSIPGGGANLDAAHKAAADHDPSSPAIYLVGNSLGAQPKLVRSYLAAHLETWASIGVGGHFTDLDNSPLANWQDLAAACAAKSAPLVGASPDEVVMMNTLTANLHFMMASFYRPTARRHKIMLEWKPFPSDWYAIQSQVAWHGRDPDASMVELQPPDPSAPEYVPTAAVLAAIDAHADETALLLLPGIQYYSGQLFDMQAITAHAHARGIPAVGWDLAHAAGNVPLRLHEWDVDFAVWCTYKYLNAGPGTIAGAFVHARHGGVGAEGPGRFRPRLAGWYGGDKASRFEMARTFRPTPGAAGFQLSNPSGADLAGLAAALDVFAMTTVEDLRSKALVLTAYAEALLDGLLRAGAGRAADGTAAFRLITPRNPLERGAQLSVRLREGRLLERVGAALKKEGVVCDTRKPDVLRVAPVPMYCTFEDVCRFVHLFGAALTAGD
ncbi:hypothetical protein P8C59_002765 [Phyllachora maydis]|uniref:Kynureninase n=1 Tax=Phyllachora maydis TaxID=1825666 RepID=A0AAD9MCM7_9PEZI|nr:hypothetical protein P8C59_002765 [Phyllachora maydis]